MSVLSAQTLPSLQFLPGLDVSQRLGKALDLVDQAHEIQLPEPRSHESYSRQVLLDTPELVVVATRWRAGAKGDLHGHGDSVGLYRVISGTVEQERYRPQNDLFVYEVELLAQGDESLLAQGSFHQLRALEEAITLHAYPPQSPNPVAQASEADLARFIAARRDYKPQPHPRRIEFPQWGVKSSRHDKTIEKVAADLAPRWREYEADADDSLRVPLRVLEEMRSSGILAAPLPRFSGGWTASLTETAQALTHLATYAPASALALVAPLGNAATCRIPLSAVPREHAETLRANQRWIAEQVTRGRILALAHSEPSDEGQCSQTRTVASWGIDGHYYLTGQKSFATLGPDADYFLCAARTAVDIEGPRGLETTVRVEGFFVHRDAPGVTFGNGWDRRDMIPSTHVDLKLEYAPAERIFGYPGCWETVNARHWSTLLFSAVLLGIGQTALREGLRHSGHSAGARAKLADQALTLDAAAGYLEATCEAETWPLPKETLSRVERVKTFAARTASQVAGHCLAR